MSEAQCLISNALSRNPRHTPAPPLDHPHNKHHPEPHTLVSRNSQPCLQTGCLQWAFRTHRPLVSRALPNPHP